MAAPVFGDGVVLALDDGASSAFVDVADMTALDPPDVEAVMVDRKRLAASAIRERVASPRKNPGELTFSYEIGDAKYARFEAVKGVEKNWRLTYTDGLRFAFKGILRTNNPGPLDPEGIAEVQVAVAVTTLLTVSDTIP